MRLGTRIIVPLLIAIGSSGRRTLPGPTVYGDWRLSHRPDRRRQPSPFWSSDQPAPAGRTRNARALSELARRGFRDAVATRDEDGLPVFHFGSGVAPITNEDVEQALSDWP